MKDALRTNFDWRESLSNKTFLDRANQVLTTYDQVESAPEYIDFLKLLNLKGQVISQDGDLIVKSLTSVDFDSINQRVGLALFANLCFDKSMGLDGTSIADNPKGQLKFLAVDNKLVSFVGEKIINDDFGRKIYYLDIAGTLKIASGKGFGPTLGKIALEQEIAKSDRDVVFLSRTQNPMLVSMAKKILPNGVLLAPFWTIPSSEVVETANWMIEKGFMSRNNLRPDSKFDARESMISWNSYGTKGDGSTWEDMTKQLKNLDWTKEEGVLMQKYLTTHGSSWDEARLKGHSFVIGAFIKK